jgi:hypothetical protein
LVRTNYDDSVPIRLRALLYGEEGMHGRSIEKRELAEIEHDGNDAVSLTGARSASKIGTPAMSSSPTSATLATRLLHSVRVVKSGSNTMVAPPIVRACALVE